jgi:hypothetical protein
VITDYASYPGFHPALVQVQGVHKDDTGAEFVADRKTKIALYGINFTPFIDEAEQRAATEKAYLTRPARQPRHSWRPIRKAMP